MVLDSEQIEEAKKKIREIRFKQYHVMIDGKWHESRRIRNADDGRKCIICGWYNSEFHQYCKEDKRCYTLGKRMGLCMKDFHKVADRDMVGIHRVEKNDWRYDRHYSCLFFHIPDTCIHL